MAGGQIMTSRLRKYPGWAFESSGFLSRSGDVVSIAEELELVQSYMYIQNVLLYKMYFFRIVFNCWSMFQSIYSSVQFLRSLYSLL
jgi:hypothetical protein